MSQGKQIKKCRQNFNVYIPPPARKAENLSQQVLKKHDFKDLKVTKVKSGEKETVNKKTIPTELSVNLDFNKLSVVSENDEKISEKQCCKNKIKSASESDISASSRVEISDCSCTCSDVLSLSEKSNDVRVNQDTVKADPKIACNHHLDTNNLSSEAGANNTPNPEDENHIFRNLWVQLYEHENPESRTVAKTHNIHKGNDVYGSKEINENCIIEIYDFPAEFKTSDLRTIFSSYISRGMRIRWVDDTHALGIYPSEIIAYEVLNTDLPFLKTRILNEGIPESRDKAKLLLPPPPPPRPKTCSASARRMVSGALGIRAVFTQEEIEEERQLLQVARQQKLLAAKQRGLKESS